jgi:hypothetical protein
VTSPVYELRQFRKSSQKTIEPLATGTLVRFSSNRINNLRGGDNRSLYSTYFVIEKLAAEAWVPCSKPIGQGDLAKRICIVLEGDADNPTLFDQFPSWEKPLLVLVPHEPQ